MDTQRERTAGLALASPKPAAFMLLSIALIASLLFVGIASAAATVTQPAGGGGAVSADTAVNGGTNTGTTLGSITVTEGAAGDIGGGSAGTLMFQLPPGFQWDTTLAPDVAVSGTGCVGLSFGVASFSNRNGSEPNVVKFPIISVSTSPCVATFGGIIALKVKPINATPLPAPGFIFLSDISASITGLNLGATGTNFGNIVEVSGAVSASASTAVASPTSVAADGTATSVITVTLKDSHGNVVSGKTVTLASSRGATDTMTPATGGVTNASGVVSFSVKSNTTGQSTYTATDTTDSNLVLSQQPAVTFTAGGAVDANSTVVASQTNVPANGSATATITVTLKDANNNAVSGKTVTLASSRGGLDTITPGSASTNANGVATFSVSSMTRGDAVLTATDTSDNLILTQQATVSFTVGAVDPFVSTVSASPSSVPADGTRKSTITVTLKDSNGSPVSGKLVSASSSRGGVDTIAPASATSDGSGVTTFTVSSDTPGNAALTATDTSDNVTVSQTATVTFTTACGPGPTPVSPADGAQLSNLGPLLQWEQAVCTMWYQVQVIPFNNDGPGINLVIGDTLQVASSQYQVREPNFGSNNPNYVMLPGMTCTWRVRTAGTLSDPTEADWTGWSASRSFRTASKTSGSISRVSPIEGGLVGSLTPTLQWSNSDSTVFYYEVQVSRDPSFGNGPGSPFLYWELRHGGVTNPLDSYTIPNAFPLQSDTTYYWRVRPQVQGDGTPVAWSSTFSFNAP